MTPVVFHIIALSFLAVTIGAARVPPLRSPATGGERIDRFSPASGEGTSELDVFVSIPPQADFVERVGGEHVAVHILVRPGQDPHTFTPTPKQMAMLSRAKIFFTVGIPFETRLMEKLRGSHSQLTVMDTAKGIRKRTITGRYPDGATARKQQPGDLDPHIWLSPPLIRIQAKNIAEALRKTDPEHAQDYENNLGLFLRDIDKTHNKILKLLEPYKGRAFYVFHPAFGYFADAYDLKQKAVEIEGKSPTPRQLSELIKKARSENVRILFVQPQFDKKYAEAVSRAIGGVVLPLDPLAGNVLKNLEKVAVEISRALQGRED